MDRLQSIQHIKDNSSCLREETFKTHEGTVSWQLRRKNKNGETFFLVEYPGENGYGIYVNTPNKNDETLKMLDL